MYRKLTTMIQTYLWSCIALTLICLVFALFHQRNKYRKLQRSYFALQIKYKESFNMPGERIEDRLRSWKNKGGKEFIFFEIVIDRIVKEIHAIHAIDATDTIEKMADFLERFNLLNRELPFSDDYLGLIKFQIRPFKRKINKRLSDEWERRRFIIASEDISHLVQDIVKIRSSIFLEEMEITVYLDFLKDVEIKLN